MPDNQESISDRGEKPRIPAELAGITIEGASSASMPARDEKEPVPMSPPAPSDFSAEKKFPFLSFIHEYVWSNTQFAEQKAAFIFATDTAFLGYLVTTMPSNFAVLHRFQQSVILAAILFLLLSLAVVLSIITPHLRGHGKGLIYFGAISARTDAAEYISDILKANQPESDSAVAHHIYELAVICNRKQGRVRWAIRLAGAGFVAGLLWLTILHLVATAPDLSKRL